jgi:hypothetical protein
MLSRKYPPRLAKVCDLDRMAPAIRARCSRFQGYRVKAGFYETPYGKFPKLQIMTIGELFEGKRPKMPWADPGAFKKAAKESEGGEQDTLPF